MILRFGVDFRGYEATEIFSTSGWISSFFLAAQSPKVTINQLGEREAVSPGVAFGKFDVRSR